MLQHSEALQTTDATTAPESRLTEFKLDRGPYSATKHRPTSRKPPIALYTKQRTAAFQKNRKIKRSVAQSAFGRHATIAVWLRVIYLQPNVRGLILVTVKRLDTLRSCTCGWSTAAGKRIVDQHRPLSQWIEKNNQKQSRFTHTKKRKKIVFDHRLIGLYICACACVCVILGEVRSTCYILRSESPRRTPCYCAISATMQQRYRFESQTYKEIVVYSYVCVLNQPRPATNANQHLMAPDSLGPGSLALARWAGWSDVKVGHHVKC